MPSLNLIPGDLFSTARPIIAHGCNCRGAFGSGVAGQIARIYPEVKSSYLYKYKRSGWSLGQIQVISVPGDRWVANLATQETYGSLEYGPHVSYDACRSAFTRLFNFAEQGGLGIAMPKIGCGLAGGDWAVVEGILRECLEGRNLEVDVYYLEEASPV